MGKLKQTTIVFLLALFFSANIFGQVTIGCNEVPANGALLDLKEYDDAIAEGGGRDAQKGLLLPRVELVSITNLFPMYVQGSPDYTGENKIITDRDHTGLLVYNTNKNLPDGDGTGLYTWDGEKWLPLLSKSIIISQSRIFLSPVNPIKAAILTTEPMKQEWYAVPNTTTCASLNIAKETTSSTLTFTAGSTPGNTTYTFGLDNSTKTTDIEVCNLDLTLGRTELKVAGDVQTDYSTQTVSAIGGDNNWFVKSYTTTSGKITWVNPPVNQDGKLVFTLGALATSGVFEETITVAHVNDPDYTKTIVVKQSKDYIMLPVFDYLVIRYQDNNIAGLSRDVDTATEITGTGNPQVDRKPLGWAVGNDGYISSQAIRQTKNIPFLYWPGDNTQTGFEAVYANFTNLRDSILDASAPQVFYCNTYATWYRPQGIEVDNAKNKVNLTITLYRGGRMIVRNTYDYQNVDDDSGLKRDSIFHLELKNVPIRTFQGVGTFRKNYTPIISLEYDRLDNTGVLTSLESEATMFMMREGDDEESPYYSQPGETKEEHERRIMEYREQKENEVPDR